MDSRKEDIGFGIVLYLGFGLSSSPSCNSAGVVNEYGPSLLPQVLSIVDEAGRIDVDWSSGLTLEAAGNFVKHEMEKRHPELTDEALNAIAWKYTFDWR